MMSVLDDAIRQRKYSDSKWRNCLLSLNQASKVI